MATVEQVAKSSLQKILVQGSEAPYEADEYQDFMFAMNNLLARWESDGIHLGYTPVSSLSDEVTVPDGALQGVIAVMAVEVAPDYGVEPSQSLAISAAAGMETIRLIGQCVPKGRYPPTLPRGAGNYDAGMAPYYPDCWKCREHNHRHCACEES